MKSALAIDLLFLASCRIRVVIAANLCFALGLGLLDRFALDDSLALLTTSSACTSGASIFLGLQPCGEGGIGIFYALLWTVFGLLGRGCGDAGEVVGGRRAFAVGVAVDGGGVAALIGDVEAAEDEVVERVLELLGAVFRRWERKAGK